MTSHNVLLSWRHVLCASLLVLIFAPTAAGAQGTTPPTQGVAPTGTPGKIWTNEDITSTHGAVPTTGRSASQSSANKQDFTSESRGATFVNPKPGQLVNPGETLHIDLAINSGVALLRGAAIMSPMGMASEVRETPPYSFTFVIPVKDRDVSGGASLIGSQPLYALGPVAGRGNDIDLAATTIDVEESDLPVSMTAAGATISRYSSGLSFFQLGDDEWIRIYARFPNGHELDVTRSTYLELSSSDANVVRVASEGAVISVATGNASVIATYTLAGLQKRLSIPVSVKGMPGPLIASPATVDFGDVPVSSTSPPRQVTITNNGSTAVKIYAVYHSTGPENCSNRVLGPGGSCTLTVTLSPGRLGPIHSTILIDSVPVTLLGNGI
jgi:hypothetical protein